MAHETDKKLNLVFTQLDKEERENIAVMLEQAAAAVRGDKLESAEQLQAQATQGIGRLRFLRELSPAIQNRLAIVDAATPTAKVSLVRETPKRIKILTEKTIEEVKIQPTVSLVRETPKAKREPKENILPSIVKNKEELLDESDLKTEQVKPQVEKRSKRDLKNGRQETGAYALLQINESGDNFLYPTTLDAAKFVYADLLEADSSPARLSTNRWNLENAVIKIIIDRLPVDISPNQPIKEHIQYFQEWFNWIGKQPAYKDLSRENLINILQRSEGENTFRRFVLGITEDQDKLAKVEVKQPELQVEVPAVETVIPAQNFTEPVPNQEKVKGNLGILTPAHWAVLASSVLSQPNTQGIFGVQLDEDTKKVFKMIQKDHLWMVPVTPESLKKVKAEVSAYLEHFQSQPEEALKTLDNNDQYQEILMMFYDINSEQLAKLFT